MATEKIAAKDKAELSVQVETCNRMRTEVEQIKAGKDFSDMGIQTETKKADEMLCILEKLQILTLSIRNCDKECDVLKSSLKEMPTRKEMEEMTSKRTKELKELDAKLELLKNTVDLLCSRMTSFQLKSEQMMTLNHNLSTMVDSLLMETGRL